MNEEDNGINLFGGDCLRDEAIDRLWGLGWPQSAGYRTRDSFSAIVPLPKEAAPEIVQRFPHLLLVGPWTEMEEICRLLGITDRHAKFPPTVTTKQKPWGPKARWIRCDDGLSRANLAYGASLHSMASDQRGLLVICGLSLYAHFPEVVTDGGIGLVGSLGTYYYELVGGSVPSIASVESSFKTKQGGLGTAYKP